MRAKVVPAITVAIIAYALIVRKFQKNIDALQLNPA